MDDYSIESLTESKNEWSARLVSTVTPLVVGGFKSIYDEAEKLCVDNDEEEKVLMTFQNLISRIPKWSQTIVDEEVSRIKTESRCEYLEELITCVHIIHLKALTIVRVGQKQKRLDIDVPSLARFIHNTYICCARAIYRNVYLFDSNVSPLSFQKQQRELELIVREGILESIRTSIPIDVILKAYIDKTEEEEDCLEKHIAPGAEMVDGVADIPLQQSVAGPVAGQSVAGQSVAGSVDSIVCNVIDPVALADKSPSSTSLVAFSPEVQTKMIPGNPVADSVADSGDTIQIMGASPISLDVEDIGESGGLSGSIDIGAMPAPSLGDIEIL
jgi:hypothetical protein